MTKAYLVIKKLDGKNCPIVAGSGEQIIMDEESSVELDMVKLEQDGFVKSMTDSEALQYHKAQGV